jgi:hypothetical protein
MGSIDIVESLCVLWGLIAAGMRHAYSAGYAIGTIENSRLHWRDAAA